jgi:hypothetical protein
MLVHKIKNKDHIVCPICGIEYRSEGGRESHIRQVSITSLSFFLRGHEHLDQKLLLLCDLTMPFTYSSTARSRISSALDAK